MNLLTQCCGLSLLAAQFIFICSQKSLKLQRQRIFMWVLRMTAMSVVFDILSVIFICRQASFPPALVGFICKLYIVTLSWDGWIAYIYMMLDVVPHRSYRRLVICMGIINLLISIAAFALPIEIVYNGSNILYTQGPSTLVVYSAAAIYSALIVFTCIVRKNRMSPRKLLGMNLWVVFLVSAAVVQFFFKQILIISFAMSLGALILFVLVENPESYIDKAIGCFNSYAKSVLMNSLWNEDREFSVLKIYYELNAMTGLEESDRLYELRYLSNVLASQRKFYVFKENDSAFSVVSVDCNALEQHANSIWKMICDHEPSKGHTTVMLLKDPHLLKNAVEAENIFAFALEEGLADTHGINVIDENIARMFRVKKLLVGDPAEAANYADEAAFLSNREQRLKSLEIIDLFASEYAAVFHVDTVSGILTPYALNGESANDLSMPFKNGMQFRKAFNLFVDNYVYSEDKELFQSACSLERINSELQAHRSYSIIFRGLIHKGGQPLYCEMKFMKTGGDNEALSSFVLGIANRDDSVRKEQAEALRRSQYHAVIQALSSEYGSIYYADLAADLLIPYVTSDRVSAFVGAEALRGSSFAEAVQAYVNSVVAEEDKKLMNDVLTAENIRHELSDMQYFTQIYHNEIGQYCEMKCVRTDDNEPVNKVVVGFAMKDAEVRKKMAQEQQLKEALSMAQSASRAKTTFLNNMSHDIRTPMNAIIGYTGLAASHIDNKENVLDYLGKITRASNHLLSLINDVLDMSRIESGKMSLDEKPESLSEIVHTLRDIVQSDVQAKQQSFFFETVHVTDDGIICDKLRLNQVLLNILSNSIKYTACGGRISMCVTEKTGNEKGHGTYEFRIKDNGMGMDAEYLKIIFEPFTRVKSSTVSGIQGTGLGMAITKSIVDMMGGKIDVKSEIGKGTETVITFEFRLQDAGKAAEVSSELQGMKGIAADNKTGACLSKVDFSGKKILLVEDNELNREIATEILEESGFVIDSAEDGTEAVEKMRAAKAGDYDLVLMDIQMPVMDGYEATKRIRAMRTDISGIPIIAMTANAFEEDRQAAIEAGMNEHIAKPVNVDKLKSMLAKFL